MRRALISFAAVLAALAVPAVCLAQEEEAAEEAAAPSAEESVSPAEENASSHAEAGEAKHGLHLRLGLGIGYGIPLGNEKKDHALSKLYSGEIPIEIEASYKLTHAISAGVYAGYGLGLVASEEAAVPGEEIESISSWRFGVQGEYELPKLGPALPFAALRVGYVMESLGRKDDTTVKVTGWEYLTVIAGADLELMEGFGVGPFVSFALGQYTTEKLPSLFTEDIPSEERAMHEWLTIGIRGAYSL